MAASTAGSRGGSLETLADHRRLNVGISTRISDFKKHGAAAIEKVRKQQTAAYMKICALLVPREMKLEHSGGVKALSDEQLERTMEILREAIARREAGLNAKVIEGEAEA